jgi:hypothetical protein
VQFQFRIDERFVPKDTREFRGATLALYQCCSSDVAGDDPPSVQGRRTDVAPPDHHMLVDGRCYSFWRSERWRARVGKDVPHAS